LEPRRRAERALVAVVAECYVRGEHPPGRRTGAGPGYRVVVEEPGVALDAEVAAFRNRPLDGGPYTYVSLDAMTEKVREGGRIVNVAVVIAVGMNGEGHREVLGFDVITSEDGAGWLAFHRGLVARGLTGTTWSSPTPTSVWSTPSARRSPGRAGSGAAFIMPSRGLCRVGTADPCGTRTSGC
jgi:putative transposase